MNLTVYEYLSPDYQQKVREDFRSERLEFSTRNGKLNLNREDDKIQIIRIHYVISYDGCPTILNRHYSILSNATEFLVDLYSDKLTFPYKFRLPAPEPDIMELVGRKAITHVTTIDERTQIMIQKQAEDMKGKCFRMGCNNKIAYSCIHTNPEIVRVNKKVKDNEFVKMDVIEVVQEYIWNQKDDEKVNVNVNVQPKTLPGQDRLPDEINEGEEAKLTHAIMVDASEEGLIESKMDNINQDMYQIVKSLIDNIYFGAKIMDRTAVT